MRRRRDPHFIPDPARRSDGHSTSERQPVEPDRSYKVNEVPEAWRKHAREPWRILFPDLDWSPPERGLNVDEALSWRD